MRKHTEDFKKKIVELYNLGNTANYLSRVYDVSSVAIYNWVKESNALLNAQNEKEEKEKEKE